MSSPLFCTRGNGTPETGKELFRVSQVERFRLAGSPHRKIVQHKSSGYVMEHRLQGPKRSSVREEFPLRQRWGQCLPWGLSEKALQCFLKMQALGLGSRHSDSGGLWETPTLSFQKVRGGSDAPGLLSTPVPKVPSSPASAEASQF